MAAAYAPLMRFLTNLVLALATAAAVVVAIGITKFLAVVTVANLAVLAAAMQNYLRSRHGYQGCRHS